MRRGRVSGSSFVVLSSLFFLFGCAGGSSTPGSDASFTIDAPLPDASPPSTCDSVQGWQQACASNDPCGAFLAGECSKYDAFYGDATRRALETCFAQAASACGEDAGGGLDLLSQCFSQELASVAPTAAQQKLASDVCATCAPGESTCAASFFAPQEGGAAVGVTYLTLGDALVVQIDAQCTGGKAHPIDGGTCNDAFDACAFAIYGSQLPPLACPSDGGP